MTVERSRRSRPSAERVGRIGLEVDADVVRAMSRTDFETFIARCFRLLNPGTLYLRNWHIRSIAYHLEQVRIGKIRRLIINMPPRSLKSLVTSVAFPAFVLGHEPTRRVIVASYAAELATKHANDFRAILSSAAYRDLFPGTRVSRNKNTETEVVTTRHGYRLATSVDGSLTGRGGDIIIVDDPLKPTDALSDNKREHVNQWYLNTLTSRLDDKRTGAFIVVMQRLHINDLTGFLLGGSEGWTVLDLPAIAEEEERVRISEREYHLRQVGDVLHAEREPRSVLDLTRRQLGSDIFQAQYQQRPVPPGGAMIKRAWLRRYHQPPSTTYPAEIFQSWDTATKEGGQNDWSVCTTWVLQENLYYLINVLRGRFDYPTLKAGALLQAKAYGATRILVEDKGVGTALIAELQKEGLSAIGVEPEHDKATRMSIQSAKFEAGLVWFPLEAPWPAELEAELFAFPHGRHDDQVDSISQALAYEHSGYDDSGRWFA